MNSTPKITVLMPVYNGKPFLKEAIESILNQTFKDFELLIINDGSNDGSLEEIRKFAQIDSRIRYLNQTNQGIGATLVRGLTEARGQYIARMDSDDVSRVDRLAKQCRYLDKNATCSVVSSVIQPIDKSGKKLDFWSADKESLTPDQIRSRLTIENCVAHPSILARANILKTFNYDKSQVPSEDYDLWLRLVSAGYEIHKLKEPLLYYRVWSESITQKSNSESSPAKKTLRLKYRFILKQLIRGHFGYVERKILTSLLKTLLPMIWRKSIFELNEIFLVLLMPLKRALSLVRKVYYSFFPPPPRILFVLPWTTMGGADKIALDIIRGLTGRGVKFYCISTMESQNEWRMLFEKVCVEVIDAHKNGNIPQFISDFVFNKKISAMITSNNIAGYVAAGLIKNVDPNIKTFDLIHAQGGKNENGGWPFHSVPYDKFFNKRLVATEFMRNYMVTKFSIDKNRIKVIHNGIDIPLTPLPPPGDEFKQLENKFIILWSGRFHVEKHPELAVETARILSKKYNDIHFILAGSGYMKDELTNFIERHNLKNVTFTKGPYSDVRRYMGYSNVLFMTSEMEGFPVVILEAFVEKIPVIAPRVGGIPEIINEGENGFLISYSKKLPKIAAEKILYLYKNPTASKKMGIYGHKRVRASFSNAKMIDEYIKILEI